MDLYSDEDLREIIPDPDEYARYQQQRFIQRLFQHPEFAAFLRGQVCKYLRSTGDPHLIAAAKAIKKEQLDVAAALSEQSLTEATARAGSGGPARERVN